jgi:eukaryotic-like serine/threonine-protein kinase
VALAVEQALSKVPADRFATAAEFAEALTNPAMTASRSRVVSAVEARATRRLGWPIAAGMAGALVAGAALGWLLHPRDPVVRLPVVTFAITGDSGQSIDDVPALSPDGSTLVYRVDGPGGGHLHVRRMGELQSRALPGTEDGSTPFFSPDGASIAFQAGTSLKKTRIDGGTPIVIATLQGFFVGGAWGPDNTIVYASWPGLGLYRVNANGGTPPQHIPIRDSTIAPGFPSFLPDGKTILFEAISNNSAGGDVATLDLTSGTIRTFGIGLSPRFVAPRTLVYTSSSGQLLARPFDPVALDTVGPPLQLGTDVLITNGIPYYDASRSGAIAFVSGSSSISNLVLSDRAGTTKPLVSAANVWAPRFSPDGSRIAYGAIAPGATEDDIWIYDVKGGTSQRFTFEGTDSNDPVWSGDGREMLFSSSRPSAVKDLYVQPVGQTSGAHSVLQRPQPQWPSDWSRDGKTIVFTDVTPGATGWDIWTSSGDGSNAKPFLATPFREMGGRLSPDGRWIAYTSNETGRDEVYVQSFPVPGNKTVISSNGGRDPVWGANGRELFYWRPPELIAVSLTVASPLGVASRRTLFSKTYTQGAHANYDVSPDGRSIAIVGGGALSTRLIVSLNLLVR